MKIRLSTITDEEYQRYEEFVIEFYMMGKSPIMKKSSRTDYVYQVLKQTGLDRAIKDSSTKKPPSEIRVICDSSSSLPALLITPTKGKLSVDEVELSKSQMQLIGFSANEEGLNLKYDSLSVYVNYVQMDDQLREFYGDKLQLE